MQQTWKFLPGHLEDDVPSPKNPKGCPLAMFAGVRGKVHLLRLRQNYIKESLTLCSLALDLCHRPTMCRTCKGGVSASVSTEDKPAMQTWLLMARTDCLVHCWLKPHPPAYPATHSRCQVALETKRLRSISQHNSRSIRNAAKASERRGRPHLARVGGKGNPRCETPRFGRQVSFINGVRLLVKG